MLKRPLVWLAIAQILGIIVFSLMRSILFIGIISTISVIGFLYCFEKKRERIISVILAMVFVFSGFYFSMIESKTLKSFQEFDGKIVQFEGKVMSEPSFDGKKIKAILKISKIKLEKNWKDSTGKVYISIQTNNPKLTVYGNVMVGRGNILVPNSERNPGGFNTRLWLFSSGVSAQLFSKESSLSVKIGDAGNPIIRLGVFIRGRIIEVVNKLLPKQQAGLMNGMLIGYRDGLTDDVQNAFSGAGLSHIMAVSGSNVAFIVFPLMFVFRRMKIKEKYACGIMMAILCVFVVITGVQASVLRAVLMAQIVLIGKILYRDTEIYTSIAIASILLLIYNPYMIFDIGYQLSFGATLSLILFYPKLKQMINSTKFPEVVMEAFLGTVSAQIGVLPLILWHFNKLSLISVISNVLVVPLTGIVTVCGFIMAILGQFVFVLAKVVSYVNLIFLTFILLVTKYSVEIPYAVLMVATPTVICIVGYYVLIGYLFWWRNRVPFKDNKLIISICSVLILGSIFIPSILSQGLTVWFLDVGEGDSAVIMTESGKTILVDGGGLLGGDKLNTMGNAVVVPFLLEKRITTLNYIISSHADTDHSAGLQDVIKSIDVKNLVIPSKFEKGSYDKLFSIVNKNNTKITKVSSGNSLKLDENTRVDFYNPINNEMFDETNENCVVFKLTYGKNKFLFTGDIPDEVEEKLVSKNIDLRSDVLKVGHHGSKTSSSEQFLEAVKSKIAIVSVGKNLYGHPTREALKRIDDNRSKVYRTDKSGAICVKSDGNRIQVYTMIQSKK